MGIAQRREERVQSECCDQREDQEGGQHDEIAMSEVDQTHDAEDQAEAGGKQRIEPAEQDALDDGVEPVHDRDAPK
jgi:hypothetical protein